MDNMVMINRVEQSVETLLHEMRDARRTEGEEATISTAGQYLATGLDMLRAIASE